jgi:inhibitor of KinA sporulation pathway (predicted exonuclease)
MWKRFSSVASNLGSVGWPAMPQNSKKLQQMLEYLAVIDVEATCERDTASTRGFNLKWVNEIIELPVVLLHVRTKKIVDDFRVYVKPTENPILTAFCTELTGITQDQVDAGVLLGDALGQLDAWLAKNGLLLAQEDSDTRSECVPKPWAFASDGCWDLGKFVHDECTRKRIPKGSHYNSWVDIRAEFASFTGSGRQMNVDRMLRTYGMKFEGRPHCGLDDARNIARIAAKMLSLGWKPIVKCFVSRTGVASAAVPRSDAVAVHTSDVDGVEVTGK